MSMWKQKSEKTSCVQKDWNPSTCTCKDFKYLESIIGDSVIFVIKS